MNMNTLAMHAMNEWMAQEEEEGFKLIVSESKLVAKKSVTPRDFQVTARSFVCLFARYDEHGLAEQSSNGIARARVNPPRPLMK